MQVNSLKTFKDANNRSTALTQDSGETRLIFVR